MPLTDAVATNVRRSLNTFFMWAMGQGWSPPTRSSALSSVSSVPRHVIDADGLRAIWHADGDGRDFSAIVRLLLLSAARRTEIGGLLWSRSLRRSHHLSG